MKGPLALVPSLYGRVDVFMDESGDLGFSSSSSKHLVVVALATCDPLGIRRIMRKAHGRFGPVTNRLGELKSNTASPRLKSYVLDGIASTESWISWGALFKPCLPQVLRTDKEALLDSLYLRNIGALTARVRAKKVCVVVDRRRGRDKVRELFEDDLRRTVLASHIGYFPPELSISHFDSQTSDGLQAADFVAGAVYWSLERGDGSFLEVIAPRVVFGHLS